LILKVRNFPAQRPEFLRALFLFASICIVGNAWASELPQTPVRDTVVETQLLPTAVKQAIRQLRRVSPTDRTTRNELSPSQRVDNARRFIQAGRASGDPRTLGYAEAALTGLPETGPNGVEVLVLRATIEQSRHRFDTAREVLDRAIAQSPGHVQARLTRATVAHVRGNLDTARQDCDALREPAATIAIICHAIGDSLSGNNARALGALQKVADPSLRGWALSLAGEIHEQQGAIEAAVSAYSASLALGPDLYTSVALVDALIAQRKWPQAEQTLAPLPATDAVLLRRWIVERRQQRDASALQTLLAGRFAAAQARGELLHAREAALFALELSDNANALKLAQQNWNDQREPADLRILASAARLMNDPTALAETRAWIARTGLRDVRVERALAGKS